MKKPIFLLSIILIANITSLYYDWYIQWWWFDVLSHFAGGFFIAMLMAEYLADRLIIKNQSTQNSLSARPSTNDISALVKNIIIVVGATVFIGVVWEFAEFIANQTLIEPVYRWFGVRGYFMGDLQDTVNDLLMDITGAFAFLFSHFLWSRYPHKVKAGLEDNSNRLAQN
ncbi:MAG: hypothetical protein Q8R55_01845 [Candidatus Taylorbacteria bacterium]|nr:hypothetical protein [Candidatus Taylorbacteria bacterium]